MERGFLCSQHRNQMTQDPQRALFTWNRLQGLASRHMDGGEWENAVTTYGLAFETAEILLSTGACKQHDVDRYLRSALDFIYTLRKSAYTADFEALFDKIKHRLENEVFLASIEHALKPLMDIAYSPVSEVDRWMQILYAVSESKEQVKH